MSPDALTRLRTAAEAAGAELVAMDSNPIDAVWHERPAPPMGAVTIHAMEHAGESEADKLGRIRAEIDRLGADAIVLSDSHAVAWTFNIRGADVSHTPLPLSYALVPKDGRPTIFIDHRKLSNLTRDHLERSADVREPDALTPALTELARGGAAIALDTATAADALSRLIIAAGGKPVRGADPVEPELLPQGHLGGLHGRLVQRAAAVPGERDPAGRERGCGVGRPGRRQAAELDAVGQDEQVGGEPVPAVVRGLPEELRRHVRAERLVQRGSVTCAAGIAASVRATAKSAVTGPLRMSAT